MKIIFIIPYFGHLPNYFYAWLKSASRNPMFTFRIYTDDIIKVKCPSNIELIKCSFNEFKNHIRKKIPFFCDCNISKLCDFKPTWGYVFEDSIKDFDWWGYCDIDLILGDLTKFITKDLLNKYQKLFAHGHMTLIKNTPSNNRLFMKSVDGFESYEKILSDKKVRIFDEMSEGLNINKIFKKYSNGYYVDYYISDINAYSFPFKCAKFDYYDDNNPKNIKYNDKNIFLWENGNLLKVSMKDNIIYYEEQRYVHFQKRPIICNVNDVYNSNRFIIVPNKIVPFYNEINTELIRKYSKNRLYFHALKIKFNRLISKILDYLLD